MECGGGGCDEGLGLGQGLGPGLGLGFGLGFGLGLGRPKQLGGGHRSRQPGLATASGEQQLLDLVEARTGLEGALACPELHSPRRLRAWRVRLPEAKTGQDEG